MVFRNIYFSFIPNYIRYFLKFPPIFPILLTDFLALICEMSFVYVVCLINQKKRSFSVTICLYLFISEAINNINYKNLLLLLYAISPQLVLSSNQSFISFNFSFIFHLIKLHDAHTSPYLLPS